MAVTIEEVYRSKRNNTNTATIILAKLLCDTASDLPSQSGLTGYILEQGCKADVISENKTYKIDSSGNWHISGGEMWQNVYTKTEVDTLLDDKQNELTTAQMDAVNSGITAEKLAAGEAALAEVVDGGAKNLLPENNGNGVRYWQISASLPIGTYIVYFENITSTDTDASTCQFATFASDNTTAMSPFLMQRAENQVGVFTTTKDTTFVRFYASDNYSHGANDTVTVTNAMICTLADWNASPKFVPYTPPLYELYQMILAL